MKRNLFTSIIEAIGMVLIVAGIASYSTPVAVMGAGCALILIGFLAS